MDSSRIFDMPFSKVFSLLAAKAERKGKTEEDVILLAAWLTGWSGDEIRGLCRSDITYGDFFRSAPHMNESRIRIRGKICSVDIASIEDQLMQDIRRLDKLVDELAKGKSAEEIIVKYTDNQ